MWGFDIVYETILFAGIIILIGYIANIFSEKTRIPEALVMLVVGLIIGPVLGLVDTAAMRGIAGIFATLAVLIILIDSGLEFDLSMVMKRMMDAALFTITVNILITVFVGYFVHLVFGWNLLHGFLLGIVSSGTTTVEILVLLEGLKINKETRHLLVLESILNDTTLIVIAVALVNLIKHHSVSVLDSAISIVKTLLVEVSIGLVLAVAFFIIWFKAVKEIPSHKKRNYVLILALIFSLYGITEALGGSGIMSVLVFALLLGNVKHIMKRLNLKEKHFRKDHIQSIRTIKIVQFDIAFFIRSFFFVFLGMITDIKLVTFSLVLMTGSLLAIMILTRFFSVQLISFIEQKYRKHAFLVATMMPRGFIATLLAFLPFNEGIIIPHFTEAMFLLIFSASFISIFGTILFGGQRGTIKPNVKESG